MKTTKVVTREHVTVFSNPEIANYLYGTLSSEDKLPGSPAIKVTMNDQGDLILHQTLRSVATPV